MRTLSLFVLIFMRITLQLVIVSCNGCLYSRYQRARLQNEKRTNGTVVFLCAYSNYGQHKSFVADLPRSPLFCLILPLDKSKSIYIYPLVLFYVKLCRADSISSKFYLSWSYFNRHVMLISRIHPK